MNHRVFVRGCGTFMVLLIFLSLLTLASGCTEQVQTDKAPEELPSVDDIHPDKQAVPNTAPTFDHSRDAYNALLHELTVVNNNHNSIGLDHYQRLESKLRELQDKISKEEFDQLHTSLFKVNPDKPKIISFAELAREIQAIADDGLMISATRHTDLTAQVDRFAQEGIDVSKISEVLAQIKTDADPVKTSLLGLPGVCETHEECLRYCPDHIDDCMLGCDVGGSPELCTYLKSLKSGETSKHRDDWVFDNLPKCKGQLFTQPPVDLSDVYEITPRGNLGPPGHTLPTDHMYIHINEGSSSTRTVPLVAPGEIIITSVTGTRDLGSGEFSIGFALCRDIFGYFFHVQGLSDTIKEIAKSVECEDVTVSQGDDCTRSLTQPLKAGEQLGVVGGKHGNFDFGVFDFRKQLGFVNPLRYGDPGASGFGRGRPLYIQCPMDYYDLVTAAQFYKKIARIAEPRCGSTMQDIPGTLQGNWFIGDATAQIGWERNLAFVYDNADPSNSVISIGGTITDPQKYTFTTSTSGTINRKFSDVTPDGKIYCYDFKSSKLLVQVMNTTQTRVEVRTNCDRFENPTTYDR